MNKYPSGVKTRAMLRSNCCTSGKKSTILVLKKTSMVSVSYESSVHARFAVAGSASARHEVSTGGRMSATVAKAALCSVFKVWASSLGRRASKPKRGLMKSSIMLVMEGLAWYESRGGRSVITEGESSRLV